MRGVGVGCLAGVLVGLGLARAGDALPVPISDLPVPVAAEPAATLGAPTALPTPGVRVVRATAADLPTPVASRDALLLPAITAPAVSANIDVAAPPLPPKMPAADPAPAVARKTPEPPAKRTSRSGSGRHTSRSGEDFWDGFCDWWDGCFAREPGRKAFESDHSLDLFTSPITSPGFLEDPRSLSELRPVFTYQTFDGRSAALRGGHAEFYGLQARLAVNDTLSFTINKLGGVSLNPGDGATVADGSGFGELHLGPKFTLYRSPERGTAAALGLAFEVPTGSSKVFQDTGSFGLRPYASVGQNFGRTSYGSFTIMDTFAYDFGIDNKRTDFLYNGLHLDFDVGNAHRFYPMLELNWYHYVNRGRARPLDFEGRDLANIGATGVDGRDYVTLAPGFRFKFSEHVQAGIAAEFGVTAPRDFQDFRLTVDLIFRY